MTAHIRIADIPAADLPAMLKIELVATALTELGVARAMVLIHGREEGRRRYEMVSGRVGFDAAGEPVIFYDEPRKARR